MKKILMYVLICMLLSASLGASVAGEMLPETRSNPLTTGTILYVGGTGPNNYTKIQDAINDASHGDTVFVYDDSSPYIENIIIPVSINLIGENKDTTIIHGADFGGDIQTVVQISSDGVTVSGFTVQNGDMGIHVKSNNNTIMDNNVLSIKYYGIRLFECSNNNTLTGNSASNNQVGIHLWISSDNTITANTIVNNRYGIVLSSGCSNNTITGNHVSTNKIIGIMPIGSSDNTIVSNNVLRNSINALFRRCTNTWDQNYWGRPLTRPKIIFGRIGVQFDLNPAQEPYDIPGMS